MVVGLCFVVSGAARAGVMDTFIDPVDGQFDVGDWLLNKRGVLFNPIIVTEPAVGYGGGGTLMYFHKSKEDEEKAKEGEELGLPPSISFAVGLGTENGTWAAGGGHFASWRKDTLRYIGAIGFASMNLDFYVANRAIGYNLKGVFLVQELDFRILDTPIFIGGRYTYSHLDSSFSSAALLPPFLQNRPAANLGGFGVNLLWDTRNNLLDPSDGQYVQILPIFFGPWMGGDDWFQLLGLKARSFHQVHERINLNLRMDANLSFMDTPFYMLPRISLRGVSMSRYQGRYAGEGEVEGRWHVWKRWSLIGFFGVGWTTGSKLGLRDSTDVVPAGGGGFRYLIARQLGLNMGMDFAGSKEQFAFYFQVGTAWR
jgi:hypothetical protein